MSFTKRRIYIFYNDDAWLVSAYAKVIKELTLTGTLMNIRTEGYKEINIQTDFITIKFIKFEDFKENCCGERFDECYLQESCLKTDARDYFKAMINIKTCCPNSAYYFLIKDEIEEGPLFSYISKNIVF